VRKFTLIFAFIFVLFMSGCLDPKSKIYIPPDAAASDPQNYSINLIGTPPSLVLEDSEYSFSPFVVATSSSATWTFNIKNKPSWLSFDYNSGQIIGTPRNKDVGYYGNIEIIVIGANGYKNTTGPFSIVVSNTYDPPIITTNPIVEIDENQYFKFGPSDGDQDATTITTYFATNLPPWARFNSITGIIQGIPRDWDIINHTTGQPIGNSFDFIIYKNITLTASDEYNKNFTKSFDLKLNNVNSVPFVNISNYTFIQEVNPPVSASIPFVVGDYDYGDNASLNVTFANSTKLPSPPLSLMRCSIQSFSSQKVLSSPAIEPLSLGTYLRVRLFRF